MVQVNVGDGPEIAQLMGDVRAAVGLEHEPGAELVRLATDPMARIDVPHFAGQIGARVLEIADQAGGVIRFRILKATSAG